MPVGHGLMGCLVGDYSDHWLNQPLNQVPASKIKSKAKRGQVNVIWAQLLLSTTSSVVFHNKVFGGIDYWGKQNIVVGECIVLLTSAAASGWWAAGIWEFS